jgi:hypothetical protein
VYYSSPDGKKLRSKAEVQRWLAEHSAHTSLTLASFSFSKNPNNRLGVGAGAGAGAGAQDVQGAGAGAGAQDVQGAGSGAQGAGAGAQGAGVQDAGLSRVLVTNAGGAVRELWMNEETSTIRHVRALMGADSIGMDVIATIPWGDGTTRLFALCDGEPLDCVHGAGPVPAILLTLRPHMDA